MLISFLVGIIGGLLLSVFLTKHLLNGKEPLATKEDVEEIEKKITEIKHLCQENNLLDAEKEFLNENKID